MIFMPNLTQLTLSIYLKRSLKYTGSMGKTTQTLSLLFMLACPQAERSLPPFLADSPFYSYPSNQKAATKEPDRRYRDKQNGSSYAFSFSFSTRNATKQLPFQLPSLVFLFLTLP